MERGAEMEEHALGWYSNESFNQDLEDQERILKGWINEKHPEGWSPMVCVEAWDFEKREFGHVICDIQAPDFDDYDVRVGIMRQLGKELGGQRLACLSAFLITEGWASVQSAEKEEDLKPAGEDPDRVEVLAVAGQAIDGRCNLALLKIVRDDDDRIARLEDWHQSKYDPEGKKEAKVPTLTEMWRSYLITVATKGTPPN